MKLEFKSRDGCWFLFYEGFDHRWDVISYWHNTNYSIRDFWTWLKP